MAGWAAERMHGRASGRILSGNATPRCGGGEVAPPGRLPWGITEAILKGTRAQWCAVFGSLGCRRPHQLPAQHTPHRPALPRAAHSGASCRCARSGGRPAGLGGASARARR